MIRRLFMTAAALGLATAPAFAHLDPSEHGSFAAGFSHPLFGLDHVLVMVAVGLWAASLKGRAMLVVPAAFVGTMGLGFIASIAGVPLPFVEPVILASIVFIGIMVALALPFSTAGMAAAVAFFAFFHGHAHGGELGDAGAASFAIGFMIATALLHAAGIGLGLVLAKLQSRDGKSWITRAAGAMTAVAGVVLAVAG
ncbi:HupE/UreJ family protein [Hoeflea sp.]|uniref:HupE/UreJ family protein n=1 Tax=Hoeflea sp. TaxID=1940281 RepID=UPI00199B8271|nr:HupE/UreJ family protein [Hoeflea sp.]MBC7281107.1 HupE/UreJ family protein [Hoeflea sp.]